jgi:hypothetical protein
MRGVVEMLRQVARSSRRVRARVHARRRLRVGRDVIIQRGQPHRGRHDGEGQRAHRAADGYELAGPLT